MGLDGVQQAQEMNQVWEAAEDGGGDLPETQQLREARQYGSALANLQATIQEVLNELNNELGKEEEKRDDKATQQLKSELQMLQSMFESMQQIITKMIDSKSEADQQRFR